LCVALARAVLEHTESPGGSDATSEAWQLAHQAERIFHGTPSGIDTGLALHQGLFAFRPQPPGLPSIERLPSPRLWLVSAAVPREGDCRALIGGLAERMRVGDRRVRSAMDELGRIAHEAESLLRSAAPGSLLGRSADAAMAILRGIGLSTPGLEALLAAGRRAGASGGKLSGAGGGGAFYLVAENRELADRVALAVRTEAARAGIPLSAPSLVTSFPAAS
jgi:mevalonate kinase